MVAGEAASILELLEPPAWLSSAACRGVGSDAFYPSRGESSEVAKSLCSSCVVVDQCAEAGETEGHGIWGGMSPAERRQARRAARTAA